jgi:hypothetical protein
MFVKEVFQYVYERKKLWLLPLIISLLLLGALIFFSQGSALTPFIYTLF